MASTGNAGSSLAGLAASILVPAAAPRAKLVQALTYGAQVFAVQGTYDDAFELCLEACEHYNWYNQRFVEDPGSVLAALEQRVAEQEKTQDYDHVQLRTEDFGLFRKC